MFGGAQLEEGGAAGAADAADELLGGAAGRVPVAGHHSHICGAQHGL